ncbi:MAG: cobyrinate a,c-diamide synthase [Dehalococcoidia bacterium]
MSARGLVIAGTASGVGKTTVTGAIAAALTARGTRVQPFKAGPDYLDPGHLTQAAGRECRNLDAWMLSPAVVRELCGRASGGADLALVEGVMGLFDGRSGSGAEGSTAALAALLGLPVVLVVDASAAARSVGAIVLGFQHFDPAVTLAGVVLNRVGSDRHAQLCREAIVEATGVPVLGALPRESAIAVPERHLGLVPAGEVDQPAAERVRRLAALGGERIDLDALLNLAAPVDAGRPSGLFPAAPPPARVPIALAADQAFSFYYRDSLELLEAWGADLLPFSPLADAALPPGARAVLLGGGFPEVFARELSANVPMLQSLREASRRGLPVYGECGGLMYLGRTLVDLEGGRHEMAGLLPADSTMQESRLTLGYREAESCGTPLLPPGERVRGHEFHYSTLTAPPPAATAAYRFAGEPARVDGFRVGSVTGTYLHTHLAARPDLARNLIAAAAA